MNDMPKRLSRQSVALFNLLIIEDKLVSVRRLSLLFGIKPANAYKLLQPLVQRGLLYHGTIINKTYRARQKIYARNAYIRHAGEEFDRLFGDAYDRRDIERRSRTKSGH